MLRRRSWRWQRASSIRKRGICCGCRGEPVATKRTITVGESNGSSDLRTASSAGFPTITLCSRIDGRKSRVRTLAFRIRVSWRGHVVHGCLRRDSRGTQTCVAMCRQRGLEKALAVLSSAVAKRMARHMGRRYSHYSVNRSSHARAREILQCGCTLRRPWSACRRRSGTGRCDSWLLWRILPLKRRRTLLDGVC